MDYLDELDDAAIQALSELGGDIALPMEPAQSAPSQSLPRRRTRRVEASYLLRLERPLATARDVANALSLSRVPQLECGMGEDGAASFCRLSQSEVDRLDLWANNCSPRAKFTKIRLGLSHKDAGHLPRLGRDPTLPQHRPSTDSKYEVASPSNQIESPIYFFFYGTLADPQRLERLFDIPASQLPPSEPAILLDGEVKTWAGKYRALVDNPGKKVDGHAFPVGNCHEEDALRVYEGDSYEVVTARMVVDGKAVIGRTFRFAGFEDELA